MLITSQPPSRPTPKAQTPEAGSDLCAAVLDQVEFARFSPTRSFSRNNAAILAAMSTAAYAFPEHQASHLANQGVRNFVFLDSKDNESLGIAYPDTGTQVAVVETDKALLLAARGSSPPWDDANSDDSEWKDFEQDMVAVPTPNYDGSGMVHKGFKDCADGIWDQLKPRLEAALKAHKPIHIAGHSLGGAIALMLADRMVVELHASPQGVVRCGAPDIGWKEEKAHLDSVGLSRRTFNIKNCSDPVPEILTGGVEAGREVYLDRHGKADISGANHQLDKALGAGQDVYHGHPDPTHRHHPRNYNPPINAAQNAATLELLDANLPKR